jgi:hypothetical protein
VSPEAENEPESLVWRGWACSIGRHGQATISAGEPMTLGNMRDNSPPDIMCHHVAAGAANSGLPPAAATVRLPRSSPKRGLNIVVG